MQALVRKGPAETRSRRCWAGLLSGGPASGASAQGAQAGDPMSQLLGGLLGGGTPSNSPNASGPLGNSFLAPIIEAIAAKIGIPPQLAGVIRFVRGDAAPGWAA